MLCIHIERELNFDCLSHVENTSVNELTKLFFAIEYDFFLFFFLSSFSPRNYFHCFAI